MTPLTAVILAAGVNRRLGRTPVPKALLSLTDGGAGPTFLERNVGILTGLGVDAIAVVVSEAMRPQFPRLDSAHYVVNPFDTAATGSSLSLLCALRSGQLAADHGLLVMDGDVVYERALMQAVIDGCTATRLFVTPETAGDDEEVVVYGDRAGVPSLIGKGLKPAMLAGLRSVGESLGMIHIAAADREILHATTGWLAGWPPSEPAYGYAKARSEHEEIWQYLFTLGRMTVGSVPPGLLYSECDTLEDYRSVVEDIYPSILGRDSGT